MDKLSITLITSILLVLAAPSAFAGGPKITGGADRINAGGTIISMTVNSINTSNGIKGSIQYSREANNGAAELFVHASSYCMWISADGLRAVVAGPAMVQSGVSGGEWFFAAIQEGGTGYGDMVRAGFATMTQGMDACTNGESSFPGLVEEGEFKIRTGD